MFSINGAGKIKIVHRHAKKINLDHCSSYNKLILNERRPKVSTKLKTLIFLSVKFHDLGFDNVFLDKTPKM